MLTKNPQFRVYRKRSLEEKNIKKTLWHRAQVQKGQIGQDKYYNFSRHREKNPPYFLETLKAVKKRYLTSSKNNRKLHPIQVRKDKFIVICFLWVAVIHDQIGLWTLLHDAEHSVVKPLFIFSHYQFSKGRVFIRLGQVNSFWPSSLWKPNEVLNV